MPPANDETAEHDALHERCRDRAARKGDVPPLVMGLCDPAEFECDAAKHQRQQHDDDRQIEPGHDDAVGHGECNEQASTAQDQPGLVAIPERGDRIHHHIAIGFVGAGRKQNADAEVEAVKNDVKGDCGAEQPNPNERQPVGPIG
jgi:hypothetical protein